MKKVKIIDVSDNKIIGEDTATFEPFLLVVSSEVAKTFQEDLTKLTSFDNDLIVEMSSKEFDVSALNRFLLKKINIFQQVESKEVAQAAITLLLEIKEKMDQLIDQSITGGIEHYSSDFFREGDLVNERRE